MANKQVIATNQLDSDAKKALAVAAEYVMHVQLGVKEKTPEYYVRKAYSENTYRAYRADYQDFVAWAGVEKPIPVTPALILQYLADRADSLAPTTLAHRVAALSFIHRLLGYEDPTKSGAVSAMLRGIRSDRVENGWREDQAPAFSLEQLRAMLGCMGDSVHDLRDRAFILIGLFGAFRQSELTGLTTDRLDWLERGVVVSMGKVKQDQVASVRTFRAIPAIATANLCPVASLQSYMDTAGIDNGPVFRGIDRHGNVSRTAMSKNTANRIIQKWAGRALLSKADEFSVHSLRASFVTVLRGLNISDALIARQTDHRNLATMQIYDRPESAFDNNPATVLAEALGNSIVRR